MKATKNGAKRHALLTGGHATPRPPDRRAALVRERDEAIADRDTAQARALRAEDDAAARRIELADERRWYAEATANLEASRAENERLRAQLDELRRAAGPGHPLAPLMARGGDARCPCATPLPFLRGGVETPGRCGRCGETVSEGGAS